jgi:metal-sulfur cluster biosynthetic enzyme
VPIEQLRREREELALLRKVIADPRLRQLAIDLGLVSEIELHVA